MIFISELLIEYLASLLNLFFVDVEGKQVDADGCGDALVDDICRLQFAHPRMS